MEATTYSFDEALEASINDDTRKIIVYRAEGVDITVTIPPEFSKEKLDFNGQKYIFSEGENSSDTPLKRHLISQGIPLDTGWIPISDESGINDGDDGEWPCCECREFNAARKGGTCPNCPPRPTINDYYYDEE